MILMKKDDLKRFACGKEATCRGIEWNQAKEGSNHQLRISYDLPPFAFADIGNIKETKLNELSSLEINSLGFNSLEEYLKEDYNKSNSSDMRKYIKLENIVFNPEFDFKAYSIDILHHMDINAFLNKYIPLIGKRVKDNHFNVKRLSKTRVFNKMIDVEFIPLLRKYYEAEDVANILQELGRVMYTADMLGIKLGKDWQMFPHALPFSLGNSKIGDDTLCISVNSGCLCYMGITGKCEACAFCYAKASNRMYSNELLKNTVSQSRFISIGVEELAKATITAVNRILTKSEKANLKFIRFNVNGDVLNDSQLIKLNEFAKILKEALGIKIAYSYTHNRKLNLGLASEIVFNSSFKDSNNNKNCLIAQEFSIELFKDKSKIICDGICEGCSYCKNPAEERTVIFLAHGMGKKGVKGIPEGILNILRIKKAEAYEEFIEAFGI